MIGNYIHYLVINYNGKEAKNIYIQKKNEYIYIYEPIRCSETTTIL